MTEKVGGAGGGEWVRVRESKLEQLDMERSGASWSGRDREGAGALCVHPAPHWPCPSTPYPSPSPNASPAPA
mgnify:CR=1 FL=1